MRPAPGAVLGQLKNLLRARIVMTGRLHEYDRATDLPQGLAVSEYELEPLSQPQQEAFINKWFEERSDKARSVLALIDDNQQFRDVASNGLMLTLICFTAERHPVGVHTRRVDLYELILRDMVRRAHKSNPIPRRDPTIGRRLWVLRRVAWRFFKTRPDETSVDEEEWDEKVLEAAVKLGIPAAIEFADELTRDVREAGLVVSHQDGVLRFLHRSFFQYLAGARVARRGRSAVIGMIGDHVADAPWRETIIMAVGHLGRICRKPDEAGLVIDDILNAPPGPPGVAIALMGDAIVDAGNDCLPADTLQRLRDALLRVMRNDAEVPPKVRAAAGSALGHIGDHRFHDASLWCLPKLQSDPGPNGKLEPEPLLGFIEIPEGEFWMGSDPPS